MNVRIHRGSKLLLVLIFILGIAGSVIGQPPAHDPTRIVKEGDRYFYFTTGDGIWNASADNVEFNGWQAESVIYSGASKPSWINTYVPNFGNTYWAPGIIYMNGAWHIYYSCSTFGSQTSAIGLTKTTSLITRDWQDQGMVVYSPGWGVNAIDASVFRDFDGKIWMTYGSYWDGIVITELDSLTGKPIDPDALHSAANGGCEASWVLPHGDYYYLFFNRGACCSGIHSTYTILMGRSESPTGPFYDKKGVATNAGGGSIFLHSDRKYLGPGHFGYGEGKLTYHYYDGTNNGAARLRISELTWDDEEWPHATYADGGNLENNWAIWNINSDMVLQPYEGETASGTDVAQYTPNADTLQIWKVSYLSDGYFKIALLLDTTKVLEIEDCSASNGANVQIGEYEGLDCQQWYFGYIGSGKYRIMSALSRRALEIPSSSIAEGASVKMRSYNEGDNQYWYFIDPATIEPPEILNDPVDGDFTLSPNPSDGNFTIGLSGTTIDQPVEVTVHSSDGKMVLRNTWDAGTKTIEITGISGTGVYIVTVNTGNKSITRKLLLK